MVVESPLLAAARGGDPSGFLRAAAAILKKNPRGVIIVGNQGAEIGTAIALVESKNEKPILNGWRVDLYAGKRLKLKSADRTPTIGAGIAKTIIDKNSFDVGVGVYATKTIASLIENDFKTGLNVGIGLSGRWKF